MSNNANRPSAASLTELLRFEWPPKMPSYAFKKRKKYTHKVSITMPDSPQVSFEIDCPSEKQAAEVKKALRNTITKPSVEYVKREIVDVAVVETKDNENIELIMH